ncbi:MAG: putative lipid II flippase FtsW [Candidatus Aquicultor secundus]|uniref:Probable peptidoglycan glycosyltransferase FtsW n=3 Tax=Candidatus Aquicultor secundus TaxID=1973895 RepID=A0A2M7T9K4_9ACTN|nr:MAG: putative lipid II flippase FtsW [Candidatus Aquicultor secundus]PIW23085.1 MAG: putative lipid II flippase FtsW [Candidatus Aquicultor secundus]PIX51782.1 MAG: putative lipid II flippase FtsW [Candidatus Aquicultor secundus]PIY39773.1 MAG: putative lipid II flippase FtsW [Candidatus Aquicultor secundus]PIZ41290.1 MAG: putative lipid II flippase FtsW [Candidatus Aquicultor secundus]
MHSMDMRKEAKHFDKPFWRSEKNMARAKQKNKKNYHRLLGVVIVMILFGLIMVLSASHARAYASTGDSYYYIKKQLIAAGIGFAALMFLSNVPLKTLQRMVRPAMWAAVGLLVAVLIPGIGKNAGGATSWIPLGGFQIQPSELAKIAAILFTADFFSKRSRGLKDIRELYPYAGAILLIILLIMKQPDMGTTLALCITLFVMLFVGGLNMKYIAAAASLGTVSAIALIFARSYRLNRITSFLNPNADPLGNGWQIKQSLLAFGSGGLTGVGFGMSRQKYFYLPAAHTDFIFAIIGEELGLLGTLFTISLFALFAYYGIRISRQCKSQFGYLLGVGVTSMVALQAIVNMGTVTAVLPITGIPMPFISYGGSSLMANLAAVGILLSIALEGNRGSASRRRRKPLRAVDGGDIEETTKKGKHRAKSSKKRARAKALEETSKARTKKVKKKEIRSRVNASNNKRGRNSGSRVSGAGSRQSATKSKKRS